MFRLVRAAAPLAAAAAFFAGGAGAQGAGGIYGVVTKSPNTPVCVEGRVCSAPMAKATVQAIRGRAIVARAVTHSNGSYRMVLAPGTYTLRIVGAFRATPTNVTVGSGWTRRNIRVDTGIR